MRWFRNLSVAKKFLFLSLLVAVCFIGTLGLSSWWMRSLAESFKTFVDRDQGIAFALSEMYAQGLQSEQATRNVLLNPADEKAVKNYQKALDDFDTAYAAALKLADGPLKNDLEKISPAWREGDALKKNIQSLARAGKAPEALDMLIKQETPKWRECKDLILGVSSKVKTEMAAARKEIDSFTDSVRLKSIVLMAGSLAVIVGLMLFFGTSMRCAVGGILERLKDIAEGDGDLTRRIEVTSSDEIGKLGETFNQFIEKLHRTISKVASGTRQVAEASRQFYEASGQMASGSEELTAQAATVATASEEMATTSSDIAKNCTIAAENAQKANSSAQDGGAVINQTVDGMRLIAERVKESAKTIEGLGVRSDQIGAIVSTIEDIADQTNLLALNAAIEAARAGEQGRGFAVVADEVRALAERTAKATREISEMIAAVQRETNNAVTFMDEGVSEVEKRSGDAARSGDVLRQIITEITEVSTQVAQIATAAEEQTATTDEISNNVHQMTQVVLQSAENAHRSAEAANRLSDVARELEREVGQFRLAS